MNQSLEEYYLEHSNKRSDKWSVYFDIYDKVLSPYKNNHINLLEIGVQNGGSLEIWDKYFKNAHKIMGCDINPDCEKLKYESTKIKVLVDNANSENAFKKISEYLDVGIDILIDDGSHVSEDIIKTFAKYFNSINEGGVYIAEDLHCSYWHDYQGGLYDPMSSITFFKKLADCINHEHWGIEKSRKQFLIDFEKHYNIEFVESVLQQIHSVSFYNSVCVIEKKSVEKNVLGKRFMAGTEQTVVALDALSPDSWAPQQNDNFWSNMSSAPDVRYISLFQEKEAVLQLLTKAEEDMRNLEVNYQESQGKLLEKQHELDGVYSSISWRIAKFIKIFKFWGSK